MVTPEEEVAHILRRLREKLGKPALDVDLALKQARDLADPTLVSDVDLMERLCAEDAAQGDHESYRKRLRELRDLSKPIGDAVQAILGQNDVTEEDITFLIGYALKEEGKDRK